MRRILKLKENGNTCTLPLMKMAIPLIFIFPIGGNAKAAKRFLSKLIKNNPSCDLVIINTNKNPTYNQAIRELKKRVPYRGEWSIIKSNIVIIGLNLIRGSLNGLSIRQEDFNQ